MKTMYKIIYWLLTIIIAFTLSVFYHELYHYFTLDTVTGYGVTFKNGQIAYVTGTGYSSEFWAYTITFFTAILVFLTSLVVYNKFR